MGSFLGAGASMLELTFSAGISIIPLSEILSFLFNVSVASKKVWQEYYRLVKNFESEFYILLEANKKELLKFTDEKIADAIIAVREGKVKIKPGYDGVYGQLIFDKDDKEDTNTNYKPAQKSLSDF